MKEPKRSWVVKVECTVMKTIVTEDCTEAEANRNPFAHAVQVDESETMDWDIKNIEPNE